mgnify:CR=1 FL=1
MAFIALGVTGGIGAYKSVEVCRGLQKRGHDVVAVMSHGATNFVGPLTFEAITRRPVITSQWTPGTNAAGAVNTEAAMLAQLTNYTDANGLACTQASAICASDCPRPSAIRASPRMRSRFSSESWLGARDLSCAARESAGMPVR